MIGKEKDLWDDDEGEGDSVITLTVQGHYRRTYVRNIHYNRPESKNINCKLSIIMFIP